MFAHFRFAGVISEGGFRKGFEKRIQDLGGSSFESSLQALSMGQALQSQVHSAFCLKPL
jgi:hypothetical protein